MTSQLDFSLFTLRSSLKYALHSSLKKLQVVTGTFITFIIIRAKKIKYPYNVHIFFYLRIYKKFTNQLVTLSPQAAKKRAEFVKVTM